MVMLRKGEWVWMDSGTGVPIGARVKVTDTGHQLLVDDEGKEHKLSQKEDSIRVMHPTSVEGVDDMIRLGDLNEAGLLRNLLVRHRQGIIYTYTGSVLVAVNPYQELPLYTADQVRLYHGRRLGELPPHVFAIADTCYFNMRRHNRDQCCIISGESGAGKTESTKLVLQFLAAVSGQHSWIEQQILEANPILEAFGNAKTIRNDNSSRFGKYVEIFFNKDGVIEGARLEQYLLEKSRVCHQAMEERNYHIFYCMLTGMTTEQKKNLCLGDASEFNYLKRGDCIVCDGRDDAKDYTRIRTALKILTFTETHCWEILKLLAALLHLGNVSFEASILDNMESSDVSSSDHFTIAAKLLEVQPASLGVSLTYRSFMTNRERVSKPLSSEQAADCRDAFVKAIYGKLFIWIVGRINSVIHKTPTNGPKYVRNSIGLLDIFGFENFASNSFEQLCINFANEQLQQFFVRHVFKLEQEEYTKEDIVWKNITFNDNTQTLDLLVGKPLNVLALIDEESHFPKGTDVTMLNKMNQVHAKCNIYIPSKNTHDMEFGIRHFAGVVYYDSRGFLEKNRDTLSSDIIKLIDTTTNKLLRQIFETQLSANVVKNPASNNRVVMTPKSSLRAAQTEGRKQVSTLSGQFRQSLDSLMKALSICQPHFIRCFKPNDNKKSMCFDRDLCIRQLRYSGMIDTIRIRKLGYPIRHTFKQFLQRYRVLLKTTVCDPKTESASACCIAICKAVITGHNDWKIGTTKIFLKDAHDSLLEWERERELNRKALIIQRVILVHRDRKSFVKKRRAAVVIQKHWRGYKDKNQYRKLQHGFQRLQSTIRGRLSRLHYLKELAAAVTLQSQVRGYLARKSYKSKREAVTVLQAHTRGMLARKTTNKMRTDAFLSAREREAREQTAAELQRRLEEVLSQSQQAAAEPEPVSEQEMVETMFEFLPHKVSVGGREGPAPEGFEDLERTQTIPEVTEESREESRDESPVETPAPVVVQVPVPVLARTEPTPAPAPVPVELPVVEYDDEDEEFSFIKFSALHFQGSATHSHITQRLRQPLLHHEDEGDTLACLTVWWIILRFMGDIAEPKQINQEPSTIIQKNLGQRQNRRLSNLVGLDQKILRKNRKKEGMGNRKASTIVDEPENMTEEEKDILIGEGRTLDRPISDLEKLHIIVGYALSRRDIRDEIYCQIIKQLVNNKNQKSSLRGWVLLSICLGIFPPTELLIQYLESFLRRGPSSYCPYCAERLRRIVANGERGELPCWIELQAVKTKKPTQVSVALMDGLSVSLPVDSACTSAEVCQALAKKVNIKDTYGFSLYIGFYEKVWSLGSGGKHVMDAISQCEQEVRRKGEEEQHASWRLYFRKELFTPWHDSSIDAVSTDLIYRQVIRGLKSGEYHSEKEDDFVQLAAMYYYVTFGSTNSVESAKKVVGECITTELIETKSQGKWIQLVTAAHTQGPYINSRRSTDSVKGDVVDYARQKWPIFFSKFYEVTQMSGPPLSKSNFIVAINWNGISFQDEKEKKLLELPYPEVTGVNKSSDDGRIDNSQSVSLATLRGQFLLQSVEAGEMADLIQWYLEGLRERSVYAVALQDINRQDDPTFLSYKRGDMLVILKDGEYSSDRGWIKGTNERTGNTGAVSTDTVLVLPTLDKPSDTTLSLLNLSPDQRTVAQNAPAREEAVSPVSLKEFAYDYFRQPGKEGGRGAQARGREKLWAASKEPIKQPLLKSLVGNTDLSHLACISFTAILKYMGDYPIKQVRQPIELTDQIFGAATQHEPLQDEVYCQIMRQMTSNNSRMSVDYGWQLLWLCTGLFPPSQILLGYTQRFLESRPREPLAADCLQRLQMLVSMEPRKLPPHQVEVDAIQQDSNQIFHKVHFPNDRAELFEVTSMSRIRDLVRSIAYKLILASADGYSLFMKTPNKVVSLHDQNYFFDSLRETTDQPKKTKRAREAKKGGKTEGGPATMPYLVIFMRKLWFNVTPGRDLTADLTFHFPQELPKYLRGYHKCTKEEMTNLAGLLFRVKVDTDRSQFVMIPRLLKELVPADEMKTMSPEDWKKHIIASYNKQAGITLDEAKVAFLKGIYHWPTFGCAFFEVKQTSEPSYPSIIQIAISKQGVNFINPKTKEFLVMHPFNRITNWSSGSTYFHITIGNLVKGNTLLCETSLGYKMDDLLSSYVNMYEMQRQAVRPRNNSMFPT
ncbi:unconventional myosin-VIIa [Oncorhynchus kisutch]|uniref:unconventional myosin-VIIa n=1 Tax=Oncorhynchus kisutch TaxID=8019 RepID=UPI0012DD1F1F|nr:unconventional myosin-VIIa [Oncorhynchus kisutch]